MMLRCPVFVLVSVAFGLAAGCFNPKFKEEIACDLNGACPSGMSCSPQGTCKEDCSVGTSLGSGPVGWWMLADGSGMTTAFDMGGEHPAALNGGVTWSQDPGYCVTAAFDGTGYLATSTRVLTTNLSYTISAWAKLTDPSADRTILSQEGDSASPFYLQYDSGSTKWHLHISATDVSSPTWSLAASTTIAEVGKWTHLVGVYDSKAKTAQLYVNGQAQDSDEDNKSNVTTWNYTGIHPGGTWIGGSKATRWEGNLSDVQIYQQALLPPAVTNL